MAIKNGLTPRFAEVGKIKIGGKGETRPTKDGKGTYQIPVKYDHFVVTTTEKGKDGNFIIDKEIMSKLGNEPKEIPIRLPFDSIDMNFFTSFQYYHGNKCVCKGDGEHAVRVGQDGIEKNIKCDTSECEYLKAEKCKVSGILSCHIPHSLQVGGVYRFRTHSWNSVSNILASLEYISENTKGILQGLPLKLVFLKKATQEHGNVNVVTVVLDGVEMMKARDLAWLEFENRTKLGLDMKLLEGKARDAGFMTDTDDPADVQAEFYNVIDAEMVPVGVSADDVAEKLKSEKKVVEKQENTGSLL